MGRIFLSYRRDDSADVTGRIYDRLASHFSATAIFRDVDGIPLGTDFRKYIHDAIDDAAVVLAVVGPGWMGQLADRRRIDDPRDFVRIEIEAALEKGKPLIPLLVRGASMPPEEALPPSMQPFAFRHGSLVRPDPDFPHDMSRLIAQLETLLGVPVATPRIDAVSHVVVCPLGRGQFRTINEAMSQSPPGTRIIIRPGVYQERIHLTQPTELVGDGAPEDIQIVGRDRPVLRIRDGQSFVRGLTFRVATTGDDVNFSCVEITGGTLNLTDCTILSQGTCGVRVSGPNVAPRLRRCVIRDGRGDGITFADGAEGVVEECEITGHGWTGIVCLDNANPLFRACQIRDCGLEGIRIEAARGVFADCQIVGSGRSSVNLFNGADSHLKRCRILDGRSGGIHITNNSRGLFEDCEVSGHALSEVSVRRSASTRFVRCRLHDSRSWGIYIDHKADAEFDKCEIRENREGGVSVSETGKATLRKCTVRANHGPGIRIHSEGKGVVRECDLRDNEQGPWQIDSGCDVYREGNRE